MDIQSCILTTEPASINFNVWLFISMIALIALSAFFSMSETAFSSVTKSKLTVEMEKRKPGAKKALELSDNFEKTLTTLLIGNNLVNTALSTISLTFFIQLVIFHEFVELASTLIITIVLLIFGEIIPKMIGKTHPESVCMQVSWIIYVLSLIFYPFVLLFMGIKKLISRNKEVENGMDESQLEVLIDEMEDNGAIEKDEAEIIHKVFDLNDRSVEDIMIPRIKMEALSYSATLDEVKEFMLDNAYSRIPVYKNDKDHIVGILYERDFFPAYVKNSRMSWKRLLKPVKFVSAAMKVDALIEDLQTSKTHIAIVSGEYGEVIGLVTMEDALEELVGEIYDEYDIPGDNDIQFVKQDDGSYIVDGEIFVDDLFEKLNVSDVPEDVPSKLSGWLFAKCESLPEVGFTMDYLARYAMLNEETDEYDDYQKMISFTIHKVKNRMIDSVLVTIRDATDEEVEKYEKEHKEE